MLFDRVWFPCFVLALFLVVVHFMSAETIAQSSFRGIGFKTSSTADSSRDESQEDTTDDEDFDLEACQRYCLGSPAGSNFPATGQVNECVRNCNDRYWKSFDKRMNKFGK